MDYLLSESHAIGKSKAKFFRSLGFDEMNSAQLEQGLIQIAQSQTVYETAETAYGTKYIIDGELHTPKGVIMQVRTIWIIDAQGKAPRFVTAYPRD